MFAGTMPNNRAIIVTFSGGFDLVTPESKYSIKDSTNPTIEIAEIK